MTFLGGPVINSGGAAAKRLSLSRAALAISSLCDSDETGVLTPGGTLGQLPCSKGVAALYPLPSTGTANSSRTVTGKDPSGPDNGVSKGVTGGAAEHMTSTTF